MVQAFTERLHRHAQHASQPPSRAPPQAQAQRPRRVSSGRKPGGQPGHAGQTRACVPIEDVDHIVPVKPRACVRCQHPLSGEDAQPYRHHVIDLPPIQPVVTAYPLHRLACAVCGAVTRADVPAGVPPGAFGPRVQATGALCTGAYHLSKRTTQQAMEDLCGLPMSLGSLPHLEQATVQAVAAPVTEAQGDVQAQPVAHLDETSGRESRVRAWPWVAGTAWVTVFAVRPSRGAKVAQARLGER